MRRKNLNVFEIWTLKNDDSKSHTILNNISQSLGRCFLVGNVPDNKYRVWHVDFLAKHAFKSENA